GKQITEDEIGYLTLHFQTSLERKYSKRESNKKASIVCPFSFGGGTPTTLDEEELDLLINSLFNELDLSKIKEFTVEAGRPDTIT
ncbi:hypothetical protein ACTPD5_22445, partial [Clostridioides difficile]